MDILQPLLHPPRDENWVTQATFSLVNSPFLFLLSSEELFRVCIASTIMSKIILIVKSTSIKSHFTTVKHRCSVSFLGGGSGIINHESYLQNM